MAPPLSITTRLERRLTNNDTYGHTPLHKAFDQLDVYGIGYDEARAARSPVRLGLVGVGGVAQSKYFPAVARLRTLWEPVEIAAFVEPRADHARKIQAIYGGTIYSTLAAMLASESLHGVVVLSPDEQHADHALQALTAGCAVLVEKPITRSLVTADRLCHFADNQQQTLMAVANKRCSPPYRQAKKAVELWSSTPAMFSGKFNLGYPYVDLLESGTIHLLDLVRFYMGDVVRLNAVAVNRYNRNQRHYPIDNVAVTFEFASGAIGSLISSGSALSFKPWERVEIYGDGRWLAVEDQHELSLYDSETGPTKSWRPVIPNTLMFDEEFGGYVDLLENFIQVIRGAAQPIVTGWDGYRALELLRAIQLSIIQHNPVELPLDPLTAEADVQRWLPAQP